MSIWMSLSPVVVLYSQGIIYLGVLYISTSIWMLHTFQMLVEFCFFQVFAKFWCKIIKNAVFPRPRSTHTTVFKRKEYLINIIKIWLESRLLFYDLVRGTKSNKTQKHSDVSSKKNFVFFQNVSLKS